MKRILYSILLAVMMLPATTVSAQSTETLFPYPSVPENAEMSLTERCNYLVYRFWERCNIKDSFLQPQKLNEAFNTWISFMPYASADTVHLAIDEYIAKVNKVAPKEMLNVGKMAESLLYSDSAQVYSEELYEPFCEAVVKSKKVNKTDKVLFQAQLQKLQSSAIGKRVPGIAFVTPDGEKMNLDQVLASRVVIFFNDPDCFDCRMAKTRLAADFYAKSLSENGLLKIVSLYPGDPTDEWKEEAKGYPENWVVGAAPDADLYFDMPDMPVFYYLDGRHKVLGKNFDIDRLLYVLANIYQTSSPAVSTVTNTEIEIVPDEE